MSAKMSTPKVKPQLKRYDFPSARRLFRSLFMEGWADDYSTWQDAIRLGFHSWGFTRETCQEIITELDELLTYPDATLRSWIPKICNGLPQGSPDPTLTCHEFIAQTRDLVLPSMDDKEKWLRQRDVG